MEPEEEEGRDVDMIQILEEVSGLFPVNLISLS